MIPTVTLITATGARPEAFTLCERWMRRQTYQGYIQWIVVDDGPEATVSSLGQIVMRPLPHWKPGRVTLPRNILEALPLAEAEKILFIEDDDYYAPGYVETMVARLELSDLVGELDSHYYHVGTRMWRNCKNRGHGSLFQVGIRRGLIPKLQAFCKEASYFLDLGLFGAVRSRKLFPASTLSLGMKGMPGRQGIGIGHNTVRSRLWNPDPDLTWLTERIGADVEFYKPYLGRNNGS
jgi:glycosyltransferase involved in cell wall biosynthesis